MASPAPPCRPRGRSHPRAGRPGAAGRPQLAGFTLVELLIVVILLGIVAGVVVPQATSERTEATVSALQANVNLISMTLEYHRQKTEDGSWPPIVDPDWFASHKYPVHPDKPEGVPKVEVTNSPGLHHPAQIVLANGVGGAFWYNAANGAFRARVIDQGSAAATLEVYERVNGSAPGASGPAGADGDGVGVATPTAD